MKIPGFTSVFLASLLSASEGSLRQESRDLAINRMVGSYTPTNDVQDQSELDLDLVEMTNLVENRQLPKAKEMYIEGGNSKSFAKLTLVNPAGDGNYPYQSKVWGHNNDGLQITGTLLKAVQWTAGDDGTYSGNVTLEVLYDRDQAYEPHCRVGALYYFSEAQLQNCFTDSNDATVGLAPPGSARGAATNYPYIYNIRVDNAAGRTIQQMSLTAGGAFKGFPDFSIFESFYGQSDYADRWIMAAADGAMTNFRGGLGNADFSQLEGRFGRGEAVLKGAAHMAVQMYVVGLIEKAVRHCGYDKAQAMLELDEAVAYFTGSQAGISNDDGVFLYATANNRALNFKTAGHLGDKDKGTAWVNVQLLDGFKNIQSFLTTATDPSSDDCTLATEAKARMFNLMKIPLIQSVLAYAYIRDRDDTRDEDAMEKAEAKGASFLAAILPYVDKCSDADARILYDSLRVGSDRNKVNYVEVKRALERNYECLGVTCEEVGGIWEGSGYAPDATPCGGQYSTMSSSKSGKAGKAFGVIFALTAGVLCFYLVVRNRHRFVGRHKRMDDMGSGTIAAVSEIS